MNVKHCNILLKKIIASSHLTFLGAHTQNFLGVHLKKRAIMTKRYFKICCHMSTLRRELSLAVTLEGALGANKPGFVAI